MLKKPKLLIFLFFLIGNNFVNAQTWTFAGAGGSAGAENGKAICTDAAGNVYTAGEFGTTSDFDNSPAVNNLTSNGSNDVFLVKTSYDHLCRCDKRSVIAHISIEPFIACTCISSTITIFKPRTRYI
jgi:hypothetical protein